MQNFDLLGRTRSLDMIFDPETGELLAEHPVNTEVVPLIDHQDDATAAGLAD